MKVFLTAVQVDFDAVDLDRLGRAGKAGRSEGAISEECA